MAASNRCAFQLGHRPAPLLPECLFAHTKSIRQLAVSRVLQEVGDNHVAVVCLEFLQRGRQLNHLFLPLQSGQIRCIASDKH